MFKKNKKDISPWLVIGGLALMGSIAEGNNTTNNSETDDNEIRKLETEKEVLEKKVELEKAKYPNSIENIKEKVDEDYNINTLQLLMLACFCFIIIFIMAVFEGDFIGLLYAAIFGFIMYILKKIKYNKKNKKNLIMKYISFIIIQGERNINVIAQQMNKPYDQTLNDIIEIISKNYIKGFYINKNTKMLENEKNGCEIKYVENNNIKNNTTLVGNSNKCPYCGGTIFVKENNNMFCKYCGSRL